MKHLLMPVRYRLRFLQEDLGAASVALVRTGHSVGPADWTSVFSDKRRQFCMGGKAFVHSFRLAFALPNLRRIRSGSWVTCKQQFSWLCQAITRYLPLDGTKQWCYVWLFMIPVFLS